MLTKHGTKPFNCVEALTTIAMLFELQSDPMQFFFLEGVTSLTKQLPYENTVFTRVNKFDPGGELHSSNVFFQFLQGRQEPDPESPTC